MGLELENDRGIWCLIAMVGEESPGADRTTKHSRPFAPGMKVFCFPPTVAGAYESVKAVGPDRRTHRFITAVVATRDLTDWTAERVRDPRVIPLISPPWDPGEISRGVAKGIASWKTGGPFPSAELREWNRAHVQTDTGGNSVLKKVRHTVDRLLGRVAK
jgi:hypothetical protein